MKILYVLHQFFPLHHTGTERLTLQIARQIQRLGNFVTVLTYEPNNLGIDGFKPLNQDIMKKEYQFETIPVISIKKVKNEPGFDIFDPVIEHHLAEVIKKFDLVHFMHPMRLGIVLKICKKLDIPTLVTLTDNWLLCPQNLITRDFQLCDGPDEGKKCMSICKYDKKIISRYTDAKFFFENVDRIFTGTEFVRTSFHENKWERKIDINTFSVDYTYVKPDTDTSDIVFGFIGSLVWHKGLHVLLEAFKMTKNRNIKLKIYGKGAEGDPYGNSILDLVKDDKRIEYCGTFEYQDLPKIMKDISVIIIPSVYKEIYPLVMQMGLAYKKPIIATKIGGMPEIVKDGLNGYLFDLGNAKQLSEIISMISNEPELISNMKQNMSFPPRIEEEAFVYENVYKELLKSINR